MAQKVKSEAFEITLNTLLSHTVEQVYVHQINDLTNYVVLDTRTKKEFDVSHLQDAIWVDYENFDTSKLKLIDQGKQVLVYCSVGYRSEKIGEKLIDLGFKNVQNLYGGIFEWSNQNKPLYRQNHKTDSVHGYNAIWGVWLNTKNKIYE